MEDKKIYMGEDELTDKQIIIIEDDPTYDDSAVIEGEEVAQVSIESQLETVLYNHPPYEGGPRRVFLVLGSVVVTLIICIVAFFAYRYYRTYINIGIPVSTTSEQNIAKLQRPVNSHIQPEVIMTSDSVLGVAMNFYELRGLKGEITFTEPDTTDTDVYLYSRCADQTSYDPKENHYLGSLVANGRDIESNNRRLGYCAMANNNIVIGIARDEDVRDYCIEQQGSFFRQFILISNGELSPKYYLKGKVERRALGRYINPENGHEQLMYVETLHKETLYDFSDALREYGFIDAIYITGGNDYSFYRTQDGVPHAIGDTTRYEGKHKGQGTVPWVVFGI